MLEDQSPVCGLPSPSQWPELCAALTSQVATTAVAAMPHGRRNLMERKKKQGVPPIEYTVSPFSTFLSFASRHL